MAQCHLRVLGLRRSVSVAFAYSSLRSPNRSSCPSAAGIHVRCPIPDRTWMASEAGLARLPSHDGGPPSCKDDGGRRRKGHGGQCALRTAGRFRSRPRVTRWTGQARVVPTIARQTRFTEAIRDRRSRLRASARAFRLFAAGGRAADRQARRIRQGGPPAGAGADRHRQHVRRAGILREARGLRHPADRRLRAGARFRRRDARSAAGRPGPGAAAHRAAGRPRGGLPRA